MDQNKKMVNLNQTLRLNKINMNQDLGRNYILRNFY